jgi:hypothetical protein
MKILNGEDSDKLTEFAMKGQDQGSKYPGMSYEDGIMAVLDVIEGNQTADEVVE